jgi:outer membrane protein assembly factor BamB
VRLHGGSSQPAGGTFRLEAGQTYTFLVERPGFATARREIAVTETGPAEHVVALDPQPLLWERRVAAAPIVRGLVSDGSEIYWAARDGTLGAVSETGRALWKVTTTNAPNENSQPVFSDGLVYFTGARELIVLRGPDGRVVAREALSGDRAHVFGRSVTPLGDSYVLPTSDAVEVVSGAGSGDRITLPESATMSVAHRNGSLYLADNRGTFLVIDVDAGRVVREIPTRAFQPVAHAPVLRGSMAFFIGRRGTLVCVDLEAQDVRWSYDVGDGAFANPLVTDTGVYVTAGRRLFALSHEGTELFSPRGDAAGQPAYSAGEIAYASTAPAIMVLDATSGTVLASNPLPAESSVRPVYRAPYITVGTNDGRILRLHREGM